MSVGRIGGSYFSFVGIPDTLTYQTPLAATVTPGTSGTYSAYVQLLAAASNTFERYITMLMLQATHGFTLASNVSSMRVKIALGGAGAESDVAIIPVGWPSVNNGSSPAFPGVTIPLFPPLTVSAGVRIAAAVTHVGSGNIETCQLAVGHVDTGSVLS